MKGAERRKLEQRETIQAASRQANSQKFRQINR